MYRFVVLLLVIISSDLYADSLFVKIYPDTLKLYHVNTDDNCASTFEFDIKRSNDSLYVTEINTAKDLVTCGCPFNIYVNIVGLQSGHYTICVNRVMRYYDYSRTFPSLSVDIPTNHLNSNLLVLGKKGPCYQIDDVEETENNIPLSYELFNNYPNPFNSSTRIKYTIPKNSHVELKIYNIIGKEIVTLVNGYKNSGIHEEIFDMTNISSGVYIIRLKSNSFISNKKMVLLK